MSFVSGINGQKEYCLSLAWILTSKYQSIVDDRMNYKKHILFGNYVGRIHSELSICPVMKDQWDYVLNVLKNSEIKKKCSWEISAVLIFFLLILLSSMLSNDRLTKSFCWSSRIELLRGLLVVLFESVEEDWLKFPWIYPFGCYDSSLLGRMYNRRFWREGMSSPKKLPSRPHREQPTAPIYLDGFQILHTCVQLLRKDWDDWQQQLCEN